MKRIAMLVLSVAVAFTFCAISLAATKIAGKAKPSVEGVIVRVTRATMVLDTGEKDKPMTIVFAKNTAVTAGGKHITQADLAEGQHVSVTLIDNVAKSVDVKPDPKPEGKGKGNAKKS